MVEQEEQEEDSNNMTKEKKKKKREERKRGEDGGRQLVTNWILMSWQLHRVTSGQWRKTATAITWSKYTFF